MCKRILVFVLVSVLYAAAVQAAQIVSVQSSVDRDKGVGDTERELVSEAFKTALSLEAKEILGATPPPLLKKKLLLPRLNELVMSYSELDRNLSGDSLELKMQVWIDRDLLMDLLKESGYYYSAYRPVVFALETRGLTPEEEQEIDRLKAMSGMHSRPGSEPRLSVFKSDNKRWKARMKYKDKSLTAVHRDPEGLWMDIWSKYFSQKEVRSEFIYTLHLTVTDWSTVEAMRLFDNRISGWDKALESKRLTEVVSEHGTLTAEWELETRDALLLQRRLARFCGKRALDFRLTSVNE